MSKLPAGVLICLLIASGLLAQEGPPPPIEQRPPVRFEAVDVYLDAAAEPLAAYQFQFAAEVGEIKIVGVEGGEHPAFREPPYHDPAALMEGRIIIADFSTSRDLPVGRTRVARLHLQVIGEREPQYVAALEVAASADGKQIEANITVGKAKGEQR
jgi:hypothetical protein